MPSSRHSCVLRPADPLSPPHGAAGPGRLGSVVCCSLDFVDTIVDGFYEVWGDYPEVVEPSEFPQLPALRNVRTADDDPREVRAGALCVYGWVLCACVRVCVCVCTCLGK